MSFDQCIAGRADCRTCEMIEAMDLLEGDCDQFASNLPGGVCD